MLNWFRKYFSFSRREFAGICTLAVLLFLLWLTPLFYRMIASDPQEDDLSVYVADIEGFLASVGKKQADSQIAEEVLASNDYPNEVEYADFDPNGFPIVEWKRMGLTDRQIHVIKNYEAKGGRFRRKEDLKKIYSLSEADYARLEPYIHIKTVADQDNGMIPISGREKQHVDIRNERIGPALMIDLNTADSLELQLLPGVGQVYASRIVRFRERLGGFYNVSQLMDVYGFDSLRFNGLEAYVYVDTAYLERMAINVVDYNQLKSHPLISPKLANAIVQYRRQHGQYRSLKDLLGIAIMDEEIFRKITPYLTISND